MSDSPVLTIHTDGASRGNPGQAAFAYVISRAGGAPVEEAGCLGEMTNNQAEYTALIRALQRAAELGTHHRLLVHSDSELLVKQMRGEYRVKDPELRSLYEQAVRLADRFEHAPRFVHVRRGLNARADQLCNEALDGRCRAGAPRPAAAPAARKEGVAEQAVACLAAAAASWARGNPDDPPPRMVWEQLWSILEEEGVLRRPKAK
jgi:ribonuclease HI